MLNDIQKKLALFFTSYLNNFKINKKIKFKIKRKNKKLIEFKKRNEYSGQIILGNHCGKSFCDFVRAQSHPYPGAYFLYGKKKFIIDDAKIFYIEGKLKLLNKRFHIFQDKTFIFKLKNKYIFVSKHRIKDKNLKNEYFNKIFT